jgi:FAD/FMN-containing dehydrogenase
MVAAKPGLSERYWVPVSQCDPGGARPDISIGQANDVYEVMGCCYAKTAAQVGMHIGMCLGGHSWAQNPYRDGGLMLDLSRLKSIEINPIKQTAVIGPNMAGELNAAVVKHQLFFPTAHAYTVGMGASC